MRLSVNELLIILLIVVIIFGPKQIPKLTKMMGKATKSFKEGVEGDDKKNDEDDDS